MASMKKLLTLIVAALSIATVSQALEGPKVAASDPRPAAGRRAPPAQGVGESDGMQAVCREVLVEIDQGYGVTSREARFVCDEAR